jgi:intein/homing endonuclease
MGGNLSSDLAEIAGIHAGDGYMRFRSNNKGEVDISGGIEEKEYYDNHVIPLFNNVFGLDLKGKSFSRRTYGFVCYKKEVRDILLSLGFPPCKKSKIVRVPQKILESKNFLLYARFLRGLFDTDGNLYFRKSYAGVNKFNKNYNHYPVITLVTISKSLVEGIIKMLLEMDFLFYYTARDSKKNNESKRHSVSISGLDGLEKWMKVVGMKNTVKISRYLLWKKFGFCPSNTTLSQRKDILNGKLDIFSMGL